MSRIIQTMIFGASLFVTFIFRELFIDYLFMGVIFSLGSTVALMVIEDQLDMEWLAFIHALTAGAACSLIIIGLLQVVMKIFG